MFIANPFISFSSPISDDPTFLSDTEFTASVFTNSQFDQSFGLNTLPVYLTPLDPIGFRFNSNPEISHNTKTVSKKKRQFFHDDYPKSQSKKLSINTSLQPESDPSTSNTLQLIQSNPNDAQLSSDSGTLYPPSLLSNFTAHKAINITPLSFPIDSQPTNDSNVPLNSISSFAPSNLSPIISRNFNCFQTPHKSCSGLGNPDQNLNQSNENCVVISKETLKDYLFHVLMSDSDFKKPLNHNHLRQTLLSKLKEESHIPGNLTIENAVKDKETQFNKSQIENLVKELSTELFNKPKKKILSSKSKRVHPFSKNRLRIIKKRLIKRHTQSVESNKTMNVEPSTLASAATWATIDSEISPATYYDGNKGLKVSLKKTLSKFLVNSRSTVNGHVASKGVISKDISENIFGTQFNNATLESFDSLKNKDSGFKNTKLPKDKQLDNSACCDSTKVNSLPTPIQIGDLPEFTFDLSEFDDLYFVNQALESYTFDNLNDVEPELHQ